MLTPSSGIEPWFPPKLIAYLEGEHADPIPSDWSEYADLFSECLAAPAVLLAGEGQEQEGVESVRTGGMPNPRGDVLYYQPGFARTILDVPSRDRALYWTGTHAESPTRVLFSPYPVPTGESESKACPEGVDIEVGYASEHIRVSSAILPQWTSSLLEPIGDAMHGQYAIAVPASISVQEMTHTHVVSLVAEYELAQLGTLSPVPASNPLISFTPSSATAVPGAIDAVIDALSSSVAKAAPLPSASSATLLFVVNVFSEADLPGSELEALFRTKLSAAADAGKLPHCVHPVLVPLSAVVELAPHPLSQLARYVYHLMGRVFSPVFALAPLSPPPPFTHHLWVVPSLTQAHSLVAVALSIDGCSLLVARHAYGGSSGESGVYQDLVVWLAQNNILASEEVLLVQCVMGGVSPLPPPPSTSATPSLTSFAASATLVPWSPSSPLDVTPSAARPAVVASFDALAPLSHHLVPAWAHLPYPLALALHTMFSPANGVVNS